MFLTHLVGALRQWRRYNQSLRELNRLGDRELADIGITRGDIPRVAWDSSLSFEHDPENWEPVFGEDHAPRQMR